MLTPREMQTARYIRLGYTQKQIADIQGVTHGTVKARLEEIYRKIDTTTRNPKVELARWYVENNRMEMNE